MRVTLGHKGRYHFSESEEIEQREGMLSLYSGLSPREAVRVGKVSRELADVLGSSTEIVKATPFTVMKVKGRHTTILYEDLEILQHGFNTGRAQQDGPRHLIFLFRDPRKPSRTLKAVIKVTRPKTELFLATYHPCTGKRLIAALKKGALVRDW